MKGIACDRWVAVGFSQGSGCQVCPGLGRLATPGVPVAVCGKWFLGSGDFGAWGGWEEVMKLMMFDDDDDDDEKLTMMKLPTGVNL